MNSDLKRLADAAANHNLILNLLKSCAVMFGKRNDRSRVENLRIPIGNDVLSVVGSAKNLGLLIDDQQVQNSCVRFVFGLRKFDHISAKRKMLNWSTMEDRR